MTEVPPNKIFVKAHIAGIYRAGPGATYRYGEDGCVTVLRRMTSRGNTYVTIQLEDGSVWRLAQRWRSGGMVADYSAYRIRKGQNTDG